MEYFPYPWSGPPAATHGYQIVPRTVSEFFAQIVHGPSMPVSMPRCQPGTSGRREVLRFANEFGMGPAARSRIAAGWQPPDETPDRWRGLLA
jgi:hypothetical protein